jgi:hypothetical protein
VHVDHRFRPAWGAGARSSLVPREGSPGHSPMASCTMHKRAYSRASPPDHQQASSMGEEIADQTTLDVRMQIAEYACLRTSCSNITGQFAPHLPWFYVVPASNSWQPWRISESRHHVIHVDWSGLRTTAIYCRSIWTQSLVF